MKNITNIQDLIKNKDKLCILVDYNHIVDTLSPLYFSDARISQSYRIIENLASLPFVDINVISKAKTPQNGINKLASRFKNIKFLKYEKNSFINQVNTIDKETIFIYIGNNEDIINMDKFKDCYTILIVSSKNHSCKTIDFTLGAQEFIDTIIEINNLCL